jgi:hypothetical protein
MKLVIKGDRHLVDSAQLIEVTDSHFKLLINTREKWALCGDRGIMPIYLTDYPRLLITFGIDGAKTDAFVLVVAEDDQEQSLFVNSTLYFTQEKDQYIALWLPNPSIEGSTRVIASVQP